MIQPHFARLLIALVSLCSVRGMADWRDAEHRATLTNETIRAEIQAGQLVVLENRETGRRLINLDLAGASSEYPVYGESSLDLATAEISLQRPAPNSVVTSLETAEGNTIFFNWTIEPARGDLILNAGSKSKQLLEQMRVNIRGCDLEHHRLITVGGNGESHEAVAPTHGSIYGDPATKGFSFRSVQPLINLFEADEGGWFFEGREEHIGPANAYSTGHGNTAELSFSRGYMPSVHEAKLFEVRIRAYSGHWADAVDPYLDWMEHEVGFVPIDQKPQGWVKDIRSQAYIPVADFESLEALARRLDPAKTLLGRMGGYRGYSWDHNFPEYAPSEDAARWFKRARELGFHVGIHVNKGAMDPIYPDLVERFRRGFLEITKDEDGNEQWEGPGPVHAGRITIDTSEGRKTYWGVEPSVVYTSNANKDWRDLLISRIGPAVKAGVDMIYLDESMCPTGIFYLEGVNGIQGIMALERGILDAYPNVVLETEQINPLNARWSSFALTTLNLGHPLAGYIYHRFVKIVPEGAYYQAADEERMDQFQSYGFMYPGASTHPSWLEIAEAFQTYDLEPDVRLACNDQQLFGYRGNGTVTAFYEKHPTRRGLVVYRPGEDPAWCGASIIGLTSWSEPGVLQELIPGVDALSDWLIYDGNEMLALNPKQSYLLDIEATLPADRFHVTSIPADFKLYVKENRRIYPQYVGSENSFFKITFTGNGPVEMFVPDDVLVYLDGKPVAVDREKRFARAEIAGSEEEPGVLLAFPKLDNELIGPWVSLPWQIAPQKRKYIHAEGDGFSCHVAGTAQIVGRMPDAGSLRIQGRWSMSGRPHSVGDAVVRINGQEVVRMPPGEIPYPLQSFDQDISEFAGRHAVLEFSVDAVVSGPSPSNWYAPTIVAGAAGTR